MIDVSGGKTDSVISFYNFGSVGQNEIDNNVGTYKYENQLIPEIAYVSDSRMIAVSDQNIMVFDGSQKPKLKQTIKLEKLIDSVFYNNKYIGVAYSNNDKNCTSHIKLYDFNGKMLMENDTAIAYNSIEFDSNNEVCVTGDTACEIYTIHGVKKFYHTFDNKLYKVMYKSGMNNYIFIYDGAMDEVRLNELAVNCGNMYYCVECGERLHKRCASHGIFACSLDSNACCINHGSPICQGSDIITDRNRARNFKRY